MYVDPDRLRRRDQLRRIVDAYDLRAPPDDLVRQGAIAATNVQDSLAQFRVEQIERGLA